MKRVLMISAFILIYKSASTQTLQTVTNNGAATTATITVGGINAGILNVARPSTLVDYGNSISGDLLFTPLNFGAATNGYLRLSYPDNNTIRFGTEYDGHVEQGIFKNIQFGRSHTPYMTIRDGGGVGIGTITPGAQLDVFHAGAESSLRIGGNALGTANDTGIDFYTNNGNNVPVYARISLGVNTASIGSESGYFGFSTINSGSLSEKMRITKEGNVGIGTASPAEKLSVNGNIRAKEIKVEAGNWPDYVFSDQYELPTLHETENYIKQNRHLPDIPTAAEVSANGVNLGDLNAKLLKKIEELTLHMIMLEKNNEKQQKEIDSLKLKH